VEKDIDNGEELLKRTQGNKKGEKSFPQRSFPKKKKLETIRRK